MRTPATYEIRVAGHLDPRWSESFAGFSVAPQPTGETVISGIVRDQAELHGLLNTLFRLNLVLIDVRRVDQPWAPATTTET